MGRVRAAMARRGEAGFDVADDTLSELLRTDPQALEWWADHDVRAHVPRIRQLRPESGDAVRFRLMPLFDLFGFDCGVVFHLPVDGGDDAPPGPAGG
jgi:hypothetical protein